VCELTPEAVTSLDVVPRVNVTAGETPEALTALLVVPCDEPAVEDDAATGAAFMAVASGTQNADDTPETPRARLAAVPCMDAAAADVVDETAVLCVVADAAPHAGHADVGVATFTAAATGTPVVPEWADAGAAFFAVPVADDAAAPTPEMPRACLEHPLAVAVTLALMPAAVTVLLCMADDDPHA
jgi:hypothetical protein